MTSFFFPPSLAPVCMKMESETSRSVQSNFHATQWLRRKLESRWESYNIIAIFYGGGAIDVPMHTIQLAKRHAHDIRVANHNSRTTLACYTSLRPSTSMCVCECLAASRLYSRMHDVRRNQFILAAWTLTLSSAACPTVPSAAIENDVVMVARACLCCAACVFVLDSGIHYM